MARNTRIGIVFIVIAYVVCTGAVLAQDPTDALFQAIDAGDALKVQNLFSTSSPPDLHKANAQGMTPLLLAAEKGHADIVQVLLDRGAEVNSAGPGKNTALHYAAQNGHINVVRVLTRVRANAQQYNGKGETPIDLATKNGHQEIATVLQPARDGYYGDFEGGGDTTETVEVERAALDALNEVLKDPDEILKRVKAVPELTKKLDELSQACDKEEVKWVNAKIRVKSRFAPAILSQIDKELLLVEEMAKKDSAKKTTEQTQAMQSRWKKRIREFSRQMREQLRTGGVGMAPAGPAAGRRVSRRSSARSVRASSRGARSTGTGGAYGDGYGDPMYPGAGRPADEPSPEEQAEERIVTNWVQADEGNMDTLCKTVHDQALTEYAALREDASIEEAKNTIATIDGLLLARTARLTKSVALIEAKKAELAAQQQPGMGMEEQQGRGMRSRGRSRIR